MIKKYQGKAVDKMAHEITGGDVITQLDDGASQIEIDGKTIRFSHHGPVSVGDFIVFVNDENIYHYNREVFLERNHVELVDLDFCAAVKLMKLGKKLSRKAWDEQQKHALYSRGSQISKFEGDEDVVYRVAPFFLVKAKGNNYIHFNPTAEDCAAEDWFVVL